MTRILVGSLLVFLSGVTCFALGEGSVRADDGSSGGSGMTSGGDNGPGAGSFQGSTKSHRGGKHGGSSSSADDHGKGTIEGFCAIVESATNPLAGPCVNLLVILKDSDGNEVEKARTTGQGEFEFTMAERGKTYHVAPGSKFYDLLSPQGPVRGGDRIGVQLRQK